MERKKQAPPILVILLVLWLGSCSGSCVIEIAGRMSWEKEHSLSYRIRNQYESSRAPKILAWMGFVSFIILLAYLAKSKEVEEYTSEVREYLGGVDLDKKKQPDKQNRYIPSHVKREVWRRDQGMCTKCGSRENLEFDHIIPVSKGGSSTARNVELLCQSCNRSKHNKIG